MIDKGRLRRAPMVALTGLGGAGVFAAALWLGTGSGAPADAVPAGARDGLAESPQPVPCTTARLPTGEPSPVPAPADPSQVPSTPVPCPTAKPSAPEPSAAVPSAPEPSAAVPSPVPPGEVGTGPAPAPAEPTPKR